MMCGGLLVAMAVLHAAPAQVENEPTRVLRGAWIATAGPKQILRGRWSAQVLPDTPDEAIGSWTLVGEGDKVLLQGTWAARKSPRVWGGTWSARIERSPRTLSGTWQTDATTFRGKTFADLLEQTGGHRIAGSWRAGRARGSWWLAGDAVTAPSPAR